MSQHRDWQNQRGSLRVENLRDRECVSGPESSHHEVLHRVVQIGCCQVASGAHEEVVVGASRALAGTGRRKAEILSRVGVNAGLWGKGRGLVWLEGMGLVEE